MNAFSQISRWLRERWISNLHGLSVLGCAAVASVLAALPFVVDVPSHSYHVDEDYWIHQSYYYRLFFKEHNFTSSEWARHDPIYTGPMARYVIGFGIELSGIDFKPTVNDLNSWWPSNEHLPEKSPRLSPQVLHAGRMTCAVMGAAAALLLFFLGYVVSGRLAGIFVSLFFACNPLVLSICRHAMADATLLFFITAAVLFQALLLMRLRDPRKHWLFLIVLAIAESLAIGCAVGTKFNGALVSLAFVLSMVVASVAFAAHPRPGAESQNRKLWKRFLGSAGVLLFAVFVGLASFGVFVFFNPYLHTSPIDHTRELYAVTTKELQQAFNAFPEDRLKTLGEKADYVWREVCLGRNMFLPQSISQWFNGTLVVIGALFLTCKVMVTLWRRRPGGELIVWAWVVVASCGVIYWIPVHWDRYLTPLLPCSSVVSGMALAEILKFVHVKVARLLSVGTNPSPSLLGIVPTRLTIVATAITTAAIVFGLWRRTGIEVPPPRTAAQTPTNEIPKTPPSATTSGASEKSITKTSTPRAPQPAETTSKFSLPSAPPPVVKLQPSTQPQVAPQSQLKQ